MRNEKCMSWKMGATLKKVQIEKKNTLGPGIWREN